MPEALATSKRKFYKFLDNLSAPAPSSQPASTSSSRPSSSAAERVEAKRQSIISSTSQINEPTAKRLRSTSSTTLASIRARNVSTTSLASTSSLRSPVKQGKAGQGTPGLEKKEVPYFSPWSHETFLHRLKTFAPVTSWYPKPDEVNEVQWARRGWECVDVNTVGCRGGCGRRILVRLEPLERSGKAPGGQGDLGDEGGEQGTDDGEDQEDGEQDFDEGFEHGLIAKYKDLIVKGHAENCLWRKTGCKDDIYRLTVVRTAVWQPELRKRFLSLMDMRKSIRGVRVKPLDASPSPEKILADLPRHLLSRDPSEITSMDSGASVERSEHAQPADAGIKARALHIALTGWTGTTESHTHLLSCNACFQRIGLWMYQPDYHRPGTSSTREAEEAADDTAEDDQDTAPNALDLVEMHREHCPYRNAISQSAMGDYAGLPAWQILWRVVSRFADEQRRRSRDRLPASNARPESAGGDASVSGTPAPGTGNGGAQGGFGTDGAADEEDGLVQMQGPLMSREETQRLDKERSTKLKRLRTVLGLKRKAAAQI